MLGDEHALYERYADRLRRMTQLAVNTTRENVNDACAFAWMQLLTHQPRRETVFPWLRTVAKREAVRLDGLAREVDPAPGVAGDEWALVPDRRDPEEMQQMVEVVERLHELPARQRQVLFLSGTGWTYQQIADVLDVSKARVAQLMGQANARLRALDVREHEITSPRALRLAEIERTPPPYIVMSIGRAPRPSRKRGGEHLLLEWKRTALEIEDFRERHGVTDKTRPLGVPIPTPHQDAINRRIDSIRRQRGLSRDVGGGPISLDSP